MRTHKISIRSVLFGGGMAGKRRENAKKRKYNLLPGKKDIVRTRKRGLQQQSRTSLRDIFKEETQETR